MGDVNVDFSANDGDVQKAFHRQQKEIVSLTEKYRALQNEMKGVSRAATTGMNETASAAVKAGAAIVGMIGGINTVKQALDDLKAKQKELAAGAEGTQRTMADTILAAGKVSESREIVSALRELRLIEADRAKLYGSIAGAAPTMSAEGQVAIAREAAPLARGGNIEHAMAAGNLAAEFVGVSGKSANDAVDLAEAMRARVGQDAGQLVESSFLRGAKVLQEATGQSLERTLAIGMEGLTADISPKILEQIASAVSDQGLERKKGGRLSSEDRAYNQFVAANANDRLSMLFNDPKAASAVLGQGNANKLGQIDMAAVDATAKGLVAAQRDDFASVQADNLLGVSPAAHVAYQQQIDSENAMLADTDRGIRDAYVERSVDADLARRNAGATTRYVAKTRLWASQGLGELARTMGFAEESPETTLRGQGYNETEIKQMMQSYRDLERSLNNLNNTMKNSRPSVVDNPERGR